MNRCIGSLIPLILVAGYVNQLAALMSSMGVSSPGANEVPKVIATAANPPAPAQDVAAVVDGNTRFGLDLYARLRQKDKNLIFSPYSISTALAMTRAGAGGATGAEMDKVLHFTLSPDRRHSACAQLIRQVNSRIGCQLRTAN